MASPPHPPYPACGFNKRCTSGICLEGDREKWSLAEEEKTKTKVLENSTFQSAFVFTRRQMTLYSPAAARLYEICSSVPPCPPSLSASDWKIWGAKLKPGRENELGDVPWLVACSLSHLFYVKSANLGVVGWACVVGTLRVGVHVHINNIWQFVSVSESLR